MSKGQPLGVKRVINIELKTGEVVTTDEYIKRHGEPAPGRTPLHGWYTMKSVEPSLAEAPEFVEGINPTSWDRCPKEQRAACLLYTPATELLHALNASGSLITRKNGHDYQTGYQVVWMPVDPDSPPFEPLPTEAPPGPPSVSEGNLRKAAERFLTKEYHGSLYGRSYALPGSMESAVNHVVKTVEGVLRAAHELEQEQE